MIYSNDFVLGKALLGYYRYHFHSLSLFSNFLIPTFLLKGSNDSLMTDSFFMNYVFERALLSLLFYIQSHNFFAHDVSKLLFLLFPYFFVEGHLKAFLSAA